MLYFFIFIFLLGEQATAVGNPKQHFILNIDSHSVYSGPDQVILFSFNQFIMRE